MKLKKLMEEHNYVNDFIVNYDETMVAFVNKPKKVVVPKGQVPVKANKNATLDEHITLGLFIAASGRHFKPIIILPLKEFPQGGDDVMDEFVWAGMRLSWLFSYKFD